MKTIKLIVAMSLIVLSLVACKQEAAEVKHNYTLEGNVYKTDIYTYEGDIQNGHPNGKGVITFTWGDVYIGEVVNAVPEGQGVMTYVDGAVYKGKFKSGQHNGYGRLETPEGNWYEGNWKDGSRSGQGTLMVDGIQQTGTFENDQPKKVAMLNLSNCLEGDCRSGYGVERTGEGIYSGDFVGGEFHGQGIYKYNNGAVYKGSFLKGNKYGAGTLTDPNTHSVTIGIWEKGKWVEGNRRYDDGTPEYILLRMGI